MNNNKNIYLQQMQQHTRITKHIEGARNKCKIKIMKQNRNKNQNTNDTYIYI